jgi:Tfp pilus assembly protein PilX
MMQKNTYRHNMAGSMLITAVMLLLIMSTLALALLYHVKVMQQVTAQQQAQLVALNNAQIEVALASQAILGATPAPQANTLSECLNSPPCAIWPSGGLGNNLSNQAQSWWTQYGLSPSPAPSSIDLSLSGNRYVIELVSSGSNSYSYRITARGVALNGTVQFVEYYLTRTASSLSLTKSRNQKANKVPKT